MGTHVVSVSGESFPVDVFVFHDGRSVFVDAGLLQGFACF